MKFRLSVLLTLFLLMPVHSDAGRMMGTNTKPNYACSNGIDDDGDTLTDYPADPGCTAATDKYENNAVGCDDNLDNDSDGLTDYPDDTGCTGPEDSSEVNVYDCNDGVDNDSDTFTDYPADSGCTSDLDDDESNPAPGVSPAFTATELQGTSCPAPCVVHFDAALTDFDVIMTREFHEGLYRWDFGDPASEAQSWWHTAETGLTRNKDTGPIVGHVYESPGTYTVRLDVTAPDGRTGSVTHDVTIEDPQAVYTDQYTWCFAETAGTFQGCPLDDDSDGTCEAGESNYSSHCVATTDFDAALTATCNVDTGGQKARCLFKGGDDFDSNAMVTLFNSSSPGLIGTFGLGKANVATSATLQFSMNDAWQVTGLAFDCSSVAPSTCGLFTRGTADYFDKSGFYNVSIEGPVSDCGQGFGQGGTSQANHDVWFTDIYCNKTAQNDSGGGSGSITGYVDRAVFNGIELLGNGFSAQQLMMRLYPSHTAISHGHFTQGGQTGFCSSPPPGQSILCATSAYCTSLGYGTCGSYSTYGLMQIRSGGNEGYGTHPANHIVMAYNHLEARASSAGLDFMKFCSHTSGCNSTSAGGGSDCTTNLFENNFLTIEGTPVNSVSGAIVLQCSEVTVRNNVFDLQGQGPLSGSPQIVTIYPSPVDVTPTGNHMVYNNTAYNPNENNQFQWCATGSGNVGSGHQCGANLAYAPSMVGSFAANGANWSALPAADTNNKTTTPPASWPGTPPAQGLTGYLDFVSTNFGCSPGGSPVAGAERGCIIQNPNIGMNTENGAKYTEISPHTGATITNFKDQFKNSALNRGDGTSGLVWESYQASDLTTRRDDHILALDANGWPTATFPYDPDGAGTIPDLVAQTKFARNPYLPSGTYTLSWTGTATLVLSGAATATCSSSPCSVTLTPAWGGVTLSITSGNATAIKFMLPAYSAGEAASPLHPDLLTYYDDFDTVRVMDWTRTNHHPCTTGTQGTASCVTTWAGRTPEAGTQNTPEGMAWEYVIRLANDANVNLWINIPHAADDDYVASLASLLLTTLETDKTVTIELSNETWNSIFAQHTYFLALANSRSYTGTDAEKRRKAIVARLAEVATIFRNTWKQSSNRLIISMGIQGVAADATEMLTYWDSATYNPNAQTLDAFAFPFYVQDSGSITDGFTAGDITTTFAEMDSMRTSTLVPGLAALATVADTHSLKLFATEAGPLLDGATSAANDEVASVINDARMSTQVSALFSAFRTGGGDRIMAFNAASWPSYVASEGYVTYLGESPNPPKYSALLTKITEWLTP